MLPLEQFTSYIKKNALFTTADKILLAVSGGKDSVLMTQLFKLSNYNFSIAHCNFNLRGDEAQRDETFVKLLAATLGVPFYVTHFDTKGYANEHQISTQMAARDLRYQWFEKIRNEGGYGYIALAHHQNDVMETLLLNLTRGTGISGLHGILPKRGKLIRPLLFLSRHQINDLTESENIAFVEDSSNQTTKYARNKIRLNVIPHLLDINPNLEQTFVQNIKRFAETEEVLRQVVEQKRSKIAREEDGVIYFSIEQIKQLQPQKLLFFELLSPYHFTDSVVNEILESLTKQSGTSFYSNSHRATINRDDLMITTLPKELVFEHHFMHPQDEFIKVEDQKISLYYSESNLVEDNCNKAFVDFEKLIFPLVIRFRQDGDRFMPLGMKQFKKLSDFLIGNKIPLPQKEKIPLLINGNGEIIWVAGLRQDNRYKVNTTTKKVAIFELSN
ncbi:tRNA lysidine(34) synthetase TilS [Pedobacter frigiditerrae]|uniref:tRNA(Ile)-lysidine synthase n=1 Tax=Pedobacter frigiditerrae TaxID=2530452 RepID=A0A4R0N3G6_9SPHI|nr:tRNA lysidine(34) synthetase TilS [Pedobacter frigiditerrae]TCC94391.1 tRNA lysidine(34) synthetase TilS [Pedobacter frigiditerrae]